MANKYDSSKQPVEADKPKPPMNSSEAIEHYEENKEYPKEMGEEVFELDFQKALASTESLIGSRPVNHTAKEVLIEMVFQLGIGGVGKFKKMWEALGREDYLLASTEMLDSRWAKQTPARCGKLSGKMRSAKL